jgi:hypothetical protein
VKITDTLFQIFDITNIIAIASLALGAMANPFEVVTYGSGSCAGSVGSQHTELKIGSCTNFGVSNQYGAFILDIFNNKPGCSFKFWENKDCHGKATVQHSGNTCVPIANKNGQFYLANGASSVSISC